MNLSPNLVNTKFGDKFSDKFVTLFGDHQICHQICHRICHRICHQICHQTTLDSYMHVIVLCLQPRDWTLTNLGRSGLTQSLSSFVDCLEIIVCLFQITFSFSKQGCVARLHKEHRLWDVIKSSC